MVFLSLDELLREATKGRTSPVLCASYANAARKGWTTLISVYGPGMLGTGRDVLVTQGKNLELM